MRVAYIKAACGAVRQKRIAQPEIVFWRIAYNRAVAFGLDRRRDKQFEVPLSDDMNGDKCGMLHRAIIGVRYLRKSTRKACRNCRLIRE